MTQHDIDAWLVETSGSRPYLARDFLRWAVTNHLAPSDVVIPARKVGQPKRFTDSDDYSQQLRRCLHDPDLPADVRAGGALILLYGLRTTEVVALRRDQLTERRQEHHLRLGTSSLLLPPPLASLLLQLPVRPTNRTVIQPYASQRGLLFPGFSAGRSVVPGTFGARLLRHGITPLASRNTARLTLAADLPAAVLADVLGIHNVTATRWAQRTKRDWHTYLAHRRSDNQL